MGTQFFTVDLTSSNIQVQAGDQLAFWLTGDFSRWVGDSTGGYSGGQAYWRFPGATDGMPTNWAGLSYDAYFQTYVEAQVVPEPSATSLLGAGLASILVWRARKRAILR